MVTMNSLPPLSNNALFIGSPLAIETELPQPKPIWAWFLPRIASWGSLAMVLYWIMSMQGKLAVQQSSVLAYHALGAGIFAIITNQEAVLSYTVPFISACCYTKSAKTYFHIGTQFIGLTSLTGGLVAIFYQPTSTTANWFETNMYSPHSWMGAATVLLWLSQIIMGMYASTDSALHSFIGKTVYALGLATCALGFQERQTTELIYSSFVNQTMPNLPSYTANSWFSSEASIAVLLIAASGVLTFFSIL